jgi:hypothetical protein
MNYITTYKKTLIIYFIIALHFLNYSCSANSSSYQIKINPATNFTKNRSLANIENAKIEVIALNNNTKSNIIGYQVKQNIFYSKYSGQIYTNDDILDIFRLSIYNWFKKNKVAVNKDVYQKKFIFKIGYISIYPIIDYNYRFKAILKMSVKVEIYNAKNHKIYDKWFFYSKNINSFKKSIIERSVNYSFRNFIKEITSDCKIYLTKIHHN